MKNVLLGLLLLFALLPSCSTDININAPYQDVTIVYGLLNYQDTVHYIRIEKGFIDKNKSALSLAQISDSIYYDTAILKVQLISLTSNTITNLVSTTQVPKDSGTFAYAPNILYKTTAAIDPTQAYKLQITNTKSGKIISAQASIVGPLTVAVPSQDTADQKTTINFGGYGIDSVPIQYVTSWIPAANGVVYSLVVRFYYTEYNASAPTIVTKDTFADWPIFNSLINASSYNITGNEFYHNLESSITVDPNKVRKPHTKPLEFRFTVGGQEIYNYIISSQIATGITALQAQTTYTNITNGLGVFSSIGSTNVGGIALGTATLDSISCGSVTTNLNFIVPSGSCH